MVVSLWQVTDDSTTALMSRLHRYWRIDGLPPAEALRRAQADLRDGSYPRARHWAAFTYIGV